MPNTSVVVIETSCRGGHQTAVNEFGVRLRLDHSGSRMARDMAELPTYFESMMADESISNAAVDPHNLGHYFFEFDIDEQRRLDDRILVGVKKQRRSCHAREWNFFANRYV